MTERLPLPPVIRIEPASACNLKCSHCPTGVLPMARSIMKPHVFERVIEQVAKHVPPFRVAVLYHGGEPFMNKKFLSMVRRVKDLGIPHVKTVSNAMLIKPEMCDDIVSSGLDAIEISLDGTSPEENNRVRIKCDYEYVSSMIIQLAKANIRAGRPLKIAVSSTQFQSLENFRPGQEATVPEYLARAFSSIAGEFEFKVVWGMQWPSQAPSTGYDILWDDNAREPATDCSLIHDTLSIRSNGDVVPCCFDLTSMAVMGNVMDSSLEAIWNGEAYQTFRSNFASAKYPKLCEECIVVTGDKFIIPRSDGDGDKQKRIPISALTGQTS